VAIKRYVAREVFAQLSTRSALALANP